MPAQPPGPSYPASQSLIFFTHRTGAITRGMWDGKGVLGSSVVLYWKWPILQAMGYILGCLRYYFLYVCMYMYEMFHNFKKGTNIYYR